MIQIMPTPFGPVNQTYILQEHVTTDWDVGQYSDIIVPYYLILGNGGHAFICSAQYTAHKGNESLTSGSRYIVRLIMVIPATRDIEHRPFLFPLKIASGC